MSGMCAHAHGVHSTGFGQARSQVARFIDLMIEGHSVAFDTWKNQKPSAGPVTSSNTDSARGRGSGSDMGCDSGSGSSCIVEPPANNSLYLKQKFDLIVFDLDDTLVPVMEPIIEANRHVQTFMQAKMTKSAATVQQHLRSTIKSVCEENPLIAHDYSEVRAMALTELCKDNDEEVHLVSEAMQVS
jgi:hypothetical protein